MKPSTDTRKPYTPDFVASMVREAVGLTPYEKVMLFVIASHKNGEAFAGREKFEEQMGFRGNRLYAVRKVLLAKGLITWTERAIGKATTYRINKVGLQKWLNNPKGARVWNSNAKVLAYPTGRRFRPHKLGPQGVKQMQAAAKGVTGEARS